MIPAIPPPSFPPYSEEYTLTQLERKNIALIQFPLARKKRVQTRVKRNIRISCFCHPRTSYKVKEKLTVLCKTLETPCEPHCQESTLPADSRSVKRAYQKSARRGMVNRQTGSSGEGSRDLSGSTSCTRNGKKIHF